MIVPFDITAAYSGTPILKRLLLKGDNSVFQGFITNPLSGSTDVQKLASWGLGIPAGGFYVTQFVLTVDLAAKVELGVLNVDGTTFVPVYPTYATENAGGGVAPRYAQNGPLFPDDTGIAASIATWALAVRITGAVNPTTIHLAGDVGLFPRS